MVYVNRVANFNNGVSSTVDHETLLMSIQVTKTEFKNRA